MKTKKIISIITALTLAAAMTGCARSQESSKSTAASEGTKTEEKAADEKKGTDAAPETNDIYSAEAEADTPKSETPKSETFSASDAKRSYSADAGAATDSAGRDTAGSSVLSPDAVADAPTAPGAETYKPEICIVATPDDLKNDDTLPEEDPDDILPEEDLDETPPVTLPEAGQLTAGEWNDNDNRGFFVNLVNSGKIEFPSFGIDPRYRVELTVKNDKGEPVANAKAELFDDNGNKSLWTANTDKNGKAYLFAESTTKKASAVVTSGTESTIIETFTMGGGNNDGQGRSTANDKSFDVVLNSDTVTYKATDIMFIMDATGSMSDEMMFLQSEFSAIAKEAGTQNTRYSVNFYRDEGDDYVTRCNDFTDDIEKLQKTLNAQVADGGGDEPEAVAQILDESINKANWRKDSVKIAFLIFDAPPHHNELEKTLLESVKAASEKGIRLVPVVSSNGSRETELFGRAIAITTGGTYVFLTDDSHIGDSHLEPIIGEYKVEKLYDIILRVIDNYRQ